VGSWAKLKCIKAIAFWVFSGGEPDVYDRPVPKKWTRVSTTWEVNPRHSEDPEVALLKLDNANLALLNAAMISGVVHSYPAPAKPKEEIRIRAIRKAFCEVVLQKPANTYAGEDWGKDMVYDNDAWVFPLEIKIDEGTLTKQSNWSFVRPERERGEVPDWDFLARMYPEMGYLSARQIIRKSA
jgi:hypothetical protein